MSAQNETLFWLAGMKYVKIGTYCKAEHLKSQHGETRIYVLQAELKMDAGEILKE